MKLKNTDATYCKIKSINISGLEAYITLIVYSSAPQTTINKFNDSTSRVFCFYLKDKNSQEMTSLNNNHYWIDRCNNYENDTTNIDINMYKEIILTVKINDYNNAKMDYNRWIRESTIIILDNHTGDIMWESEELHLISQEIVTPDIQDLSITSTKDKHITISFKEQFESQEDFNYSNANIHTDVNIISNYTNKIIEAYTDVSKDNNMINLTSINTFDTPVIIQINIVNSVGDILSQKTKLYNPLNTYKVYIKSNAGIKSITNCSIDNKKVISINK
jgi:hypothetical protein